MRHDMVSPLMQKLSTYMAVALRRKLPQEVAERAKLHLVDTFAAIISGSRLLPGKRAIAYVKPSGASPATRLISRLSHKVSSSCSSCGSSRRCRRTGDPTNLEFDPFRSDLLVAYHNKVTAPWVAKVAKVRRVSAEERAAEVGRELKEMNAAYYYRFELADFRRAKRRDVSTIVQRRPGKPIACGLNDFASCPEVLS